MKQFCKKISFLIFSLSVLVFPVFCLAKEEAPLPTFVSVKADETISKNFYFTGESAEILGNLEKDAYLIGNNVKVSGKVNGNLFVIANNFDFSGEVLGSVFVISSSANISGPISGSLFSLASNINISNEVKQNVRSLSGNFNLSDTGKIGWALSALSGSLNIAGEVGDDIDAMSGSAYLNSSVNGNVNINLDNEGSLTIQKNAKIAGDLNYTAAKDATVESGAEISGKINKIMPEKGEKTSFNAMMLLGKLISLLGMLVVGMFFVYFWRFKIIIFTDEILKTPMKYLGLGAAYFIITPILCFILLLTVIGAPLAGIAIGLYSIAIYLAKIVAGIGLAVFLLEKFKTSKGKKPLKMELMKVMFIGVIVFFILINIPILGWIVNLVGMFIGLGVMMEVEKMILFPKKK